MSDRVEVTVRRRLPAFVLLLALGALLISVCHGSHGHTLAPVGGATVSAPGLPHGCDRSEERWTFDAHLPSQATAAPLAAPGADGAVPLAYEKVAPADPRAGRAGDRAGPCTAPGRLLIALGVDRN